MPTFAEWEALRKAQMGHQAIVPETTSGPSLLPSGASALGSVFGLAAPALTLPGAALGSAVGELSSSLPKLIEMARHGGGLMGPMSSEGVGEAMAAPAEHIAGDVLKTGALNAVPGLVGKGLTAAGSGLSKIGASEAANMPMQYRAAVGPLLKLLGVPTEMSAAAEVGSMAGPAVARTVGPMATRVGEAMPSSVVSGLRNAAGLGAEPTSGGGVVPSRDWSNPPPAQNTNWAKRSFENPYQMSPSAEVPSPGPSGKLPESWKRFARPTAPVNPPSAPGESAAPEFSFEGENLGKADMGEPVSTADKFAQAQQLQASLAAERQLAQLSQRGRARASF